MKTLTRFAAVTIAALTFAACAGQDPEPTEPTLAVEMWEIASDADAVLAQPPADVMVADLPISDALGDVCECTSIECVSSWVNENFGCGVCVSVECVEMTKGGCVPCEGDNSYR